ncbi:MAG: hypothetical protein ACR2QA_16885 [Solirubrobacteraceae bacterium]
MNDLASPASWSSRTPAVWLAWLHPVLQRQIYAIRGYVPAIDLIHGDPDP